MIVYRLFSYIGTNEMNKWIDSTVNMRFLSRFWFCKRRCSVSQRRVHAAYTKHWLLMCKKNCLFYIATLTFRKKKKATLTQVSTRHVFAGLYYILFVINEIYGKIYLVRYYFPSKNIFWLLTYGADSEGSHSQWILRLK